MRQPTLTELANYYAYGSYAPAIEVHNEFDDERRGSYIRGASDVLHRIHDELKLLVSYYSEESPNIEAEEAARTALYSVERLYPQEFGPPREVEARLVTKDET